MQLVNEDCPESPASIALRRLPQLFAWNIPFLLRVGLNLLMRP